MKAEINEEYVLMIIPENRVEGMGIEKWYDEHVKVNQAPIVFYAEPLDKNGNTELSTPIRIGEVRVPS